MKLKWSKFLFLLLGWCVLNCSVVLAKNKSGRSKARAYSFFADGKKSSQGECDSERKLPRKMKRKSEFLKVKEYLGSEPMESAGAEESWKHYFSSQSSCNDNLRKQQ